MMKERRRAGVHKFTFVRWKEWIYWARSCHVSSPLIFALRFLLLCREHPLKINQWNEDHSWGFIHSPLRQLFGLAKSVTGKCGKTDLTLVISGVIVMMMMMMMMGS